MKAMRIPMQNFERRPRQASAMHGFADIVFEDRNDTLRTALQVGVAALIGMVGTFGRAWLGF